MLNSLLKIGAIVIAGTFLKPRIKGLMTLILFWSLLWFLQSEYLNYVDYSGDASYVLQSSIIKVGLILLSLLVYGFMVERRLLGHKWTGQSSSQNNMELDSQGDDGFDFIRNKKTLKTESDQLLNK